MNNVSKAALRLFDKIKPYVHERHYIVCAFPTTEVGNIGAIEKKDIHRYIGLSAGHTRKLLRELMFAGYIAYFEVGPIVKIAVNPAVYRVHTDIEPSALIVSMFRQQLCAAEVSAVE